MLWLCYLVTQVLETSTHRANHHSAFSPVPASFPSTQSCCIVVVITMLSLQKLCFCLGYFSVLVEIKKKKITIQFFHERLSTDYFGKLLQIVQFFCEEKLHLFSSGLLLMFHLHYSFLNVGNQFSNKNLILFVTSYSMCK